MRQAQHPTTFPERLPEPTSQSLYRSVFPVPCTDEKTRKSLHQQRSLYWYECTLHPDEDTPSGQHQRYFLFPQVWLFSNIFRPAITLQDSTDSENLLDNRQSFLRVLSR